MNEVWGEEVLKLPACRVVYGEKKEMLFHGPRVRMGMYEGVPTRVCPHTTTGRADYFGPLVNRCSILLTKAPCRIESHLRKLWRICSLCFHLLLGEWHC